MAAFTRDGISVLRRGLIYEYSSAAELAGQLAAAVGIRQSAAPIPESTAHVTSISTEPVTPGALPRTPPPETPADLRPKRTSLVSAWHLILAIGFIAVVGIGGYLTYLSLNQTREIVPPSQELAVLSVQSDPPGASILLDGKPPPGPANTFSHVPFGTHQLTATLNNYEPIKQEIEVRRGMTPKIALKLTPIQEIAALSVQSDPAGASILLDGKPPLWPSNAFSHVPFGTHQLTATLNDYEPLNQDLEVRRGMAPEIHLQLKQSQEIAALSVESDPPGASILLDGRPPQTSPNAFTHIPFGTHQLAATLENYESIKQEIEIRRGMNPEIRLKLNKKADPIAEFVAETKKYDESSPQYLTAYVRLVQFVTTSKAANSGEYTKELGRIIEQLRTKAPPIGKNEFSLSFKESIKDAANLDILPAIIWLAENEKGSESLILFLRAANLGDSYAMMRMGRFYLNEGTPSDDDKAFGWLKRAYESPDSNLDAGAYLGACYLSGRGTKKDVQKAEEIILPLANRNVISAMTIAGNLLEYRAADKQKEAERSTTPLKRKQPLNAEADELD